MLVHTQCFKQPFSLIVDDVEQFHCSELLVDVITKDVRVLHLGIYQVWDKLSEYSTSHQMLLVTAGRIAKKASEVLSILVFQVSFVTAREISNNFVLSMEDIFDVIKNITQWKVSSFK